MSKHRSLSNALLTPEKLAFIRGDNATKADDAPGVLSARQSEQAVAETAVELQEPTESDRLTKTHRGRTSTVAKDTVLKSNSRLANDDYLVAITTRLQARTAEALRRAYLEQKLNRREPATQQEIIEAALQTWLRKHAFLA